MPITNDSLPAKKMVLFFIVDTSSSMHGDKIGAVNNAGEELVPEIKKISQDSNANIEIAVLKFDTTADWIPHETTIPAENFTWIPLQAEGITSMGEAFKKLKEKLTRKEGGFMQSPTGSYAPVFILMTDGQPTDNADSALEELKKNKWFQAGIKIGIAIGNDADKTILKKFTGSEESVFTVHTLDALKKIIKIVSVTSSTIGSKSTDTATKSKQEQVITDINKELKDEMDTGEISSGTEDDDWDDEDW